MRLLVACVFSEPQMITGHAGTVPGGTRPTVIAVA
jgi:hypothetical protein